MTGTFVVGHGADAEMETFVPASMTVHLYAEDGESIPAPNVMEILRHGGRQAVRSLTGGESVSNLFLTPLSHNQYETELGAAQDGQVVYFVGYDIPVADRTGYTLCAADCAAEKGVHNCLGLFGVFKDEPELHLLVCLDVIVYEGTADEDNERKALPWETEPEHYDRITDLAGQILEAVGYNSDTGGIATFGSLAAANLFDALEYEDQAKLMTFEPVQRWSYVRHARATLDSLGEEGFRAFCAQQEDWVKDIYRLDPNGVGQYVA
jgi:putative adhesin Stv-like protein